MLEYERKNFIDDYNAIRILYWHGLIDVNEANELKESLLVLIIKSLMQEGENNEE